ncbi:recombinase family protein [Streptomyces sp. NPDC051976]|uniref:recombinase family protein n=1 Tax=Streptomyces sp. NPDC051976 TaxID=3154947 RepID=UPI0034142119
MPVTPTETEQAGRARQLRNEEELSFRDIAAALDAEGLPLKHGGRWRPETVRRMLANATDRPPTLRKRTA